MRVKYGQIEIDMRARNINSKPSVVDVINPFINIPDRTEEFTGEAKQSNIRLQDQSEADRRQRELLKQNRIIVTKTDKYIHAIDTIIEWAQRAKGQSVTIDYHYFNFEDRWMVARNLFEPFLNELKNFGCFQNWSIGRTAYTFTEVNIGKLIEYKASKTKNTHEPMQMKVKGLFEELSAIAQTKKKGKGKFPHKLPAGTRWENIFIKFLDKEKVHIEVKQFKYYTNYKEMGFVGRGKDPRPSEAWIFLRVLARLNGELTINDPEKKDLYKKQKELLAKSLQDYFSIDYDPFYPYWSSPEKSGNSYKIKITLIPRPKDENEKNKD